MWSGPPHHSSTEEGERAEDSAPVGQSQQPQASYSLASESRMNKTKKEGKGDIRRDGGKGVAVAVPPATPRSSDPPLRTRKTQRLDMEDQTVD